MYGTRWLILNKLKQTILAIFTWECSYTHKTKGAFEGARGAIQTYGPSAPSKAPLGLCLCSYNGSIWSYTTRSIISMQPTFGSHLVISPTWARSITEQWLLLWSQNSSFSSICVGDQENNFSTYSFQPISKWELIPGNFQHAWHSFMIY